MKKAVLAFIFFLIGLMFVMAACAKQDAEKEIPWEERFTYDQSNDVVVLVTVGDTGGYSFWADADLTYLDGRLTELVLYDPTLLAYRVSEDWEGGAHVYSEAEIQRIIDLLRDIPGTEEVIEALEQGWLLTEAST